MPFGSRTRVGSRNHVLDEGPDLHKLLWCLWWFSVIRPSQHHCWSLQGPQSTYSKPVQVNHPPAFILPSSTTWTVGCWALPLTTVKPQLQQRCFSKHKPHAGHRNWPWPSNSSKRGTKHVFPVNFAKIHSVVPGIFHTQTKKSQRQKQNLTQFTACGNNSVSRLLRCNFNHILLMFSSTYCRSTKLRQRLSRIFHLNNSVLYTTWSHSARSYDSCNAWKQLQTCFQS